MEAIAKLLHVGMLVGRSFVAVNRDPLIHGITIEVFRFAQRLHDQLLEILGEENEGILVREDHHIALTFAIAFVVPGQSESHRGIVFHVGRAGQFVHLFCSGEHFIEVDILNGHRHEAHGREHGSAAADPVFHGEGGDESFLAGKLIQLRALAGDGNGVLGKVESGFLVGVLGFEHSVAGFGSSSRFGNDNG